MTLRTPCLPACTRTQIVPHGAVDESDFFTLSASGVTHFQSGKADFTELVRCHMPAVTLPVPRYLLSVTRRTDWLTKEHTIPRAAQDQWQREYYLFNEVLHIRLFRTYRIWKAFKVWRTYVRDFKMRTHSHSLEQKLFFLNNIFRKHESALPAGYSPVAS
jgi:dynein heavy chain